jgi:acetoin:2,6-dichlorophenolindophenol oxidoreductase subunit alpha
VATCTTSPCEQPDSPSVPCLEQDRGYTREFLAELYRQLYAIRVFETRCIKLYRQGLIRGYFHPYLGEEAIAVGICAALEDKDHIISTHRGHGHCIAWGAELNKMMAELLGKETGYCGGRGGSMHIAQGGEGNLGANGIVGAGIPIGVGAALASSIRGDGGVVAIFYSDGAANNGVFPEAMNLAAIWNLPVIFVLENNHFAVSTPIEQVCRTRDLCDRGIGYGVESMIVDGNDVLQVYEHGLAAATQCRQGRGPVLIECKTYRQMGHHVNDPGTYMPRERLEYYQAKDPVKMGRQYLREKGKMAEEEVGRIESEVDLLLEEAVEFARNSGEPDVKQFLAELEGCQ